MSRTVMAVLLFVIVCSAVPRGALGVPVVDGSKDAEYGRAVSVQTVNTQFGDNASELDAAYAAVREGRLYLLLTGNIEANFNKLEVFFDSLPGGERTLTAAGLPHAEDSVYNLAGLTFDAGFAPDRYLFVRRGFGRLDLDYLTLGGQGSFSSHRDVLGGADFGHGLTGTGANALPIEVAYDGSNAAGVIDGTAAADQAAAEAVATGLELSVALSDLGVVGDSFRVAVFQNNNEHNILSNQVLGGIAAPWGNMGGDGIGTYTGTVSGIDFNNFAGEQFFTVPEPSVLPLTAFGALSLLRRSRHRRPAAGPSIA
ncbi:MAG: hypothetical protein JWO31_2494 [Phycisphaerales bacterium]|nr:hypothetical protein [Phycisphaerales bacterium]